MLTRRGILLMVGAAAAVTHAQSNLDMSLQSGALQNVVEADSSVYYGAPFNDLCSKVVTIKMNGANSVTVAGTTRGATRRDPGMPCDDNQPPPQQGVWYNFAVPGPEDSVSVSTCNASATFDTNVHVYQGENCDNLICWTTNDTTDAGCEYTTTDLSDSNVVKTLWVYVSGAAADDETISGGDFYLTVAMEHGGGEAFEVPPPDGPI